MLSVCILYVCDVIVLCFVKCVCVCVLSVCILYVCDVIVLCFVKCVCVCKKKRKKEEVMSSCYAL